MENKNKNTQKGKCIPEWKKAGFKSQREHDEWLNEMYEDMRMGVI